MAKYTSLTKGMISYDIHEFVLRELCPTGMSFDEGSAFVKDLFERYENNIKKMLLELPIENEA